MIKKVVLLLIILLLIIQMFFLVSAQTTVSAAPEKPEVYYFWQHGCPACSQMSPFLEDLANKNKITLHEYEIHEAGNKELFYQMLGEYGVPRDRQGYTPTILIKGNYFIGYSQSITQAINNVIAGQTGDSDNGQTTPIDKIEFTIFGKKFSINKSASLIVLGILLGLADGVNPCTFAILLFLISYLFTISASRKKILKLGLAFTFTIFVIYVFIMLGLFHLIGIVTIK